MQIPMWGEALRDLLFAPMAEPHAGLARYKYRGGRPPRGKKYPNANARGISPKLYARFQAATAGLEHDMEQAYANALENGGVVWDYKAKAEKDIRAANPASVLMDMTDGCDAVVSRLAALSRLFFTDGNHRAAELALRVFKAKRRVWNRRSAA
jgi:hypothetical protein